MIKRIHLLFNIFRDWVFLKQNRRNISIGTGVSINRGSKITTETTIGDHTLINGKMITKGAESVKFGKYCAIGHDVRIITSNHLMTYPNMQMSLQNQCGFCPIVDKTGPVHVGNGVWMGDMAIILPGVKIGDGSVVGAYSVVTKDISPFSIVAGVPARIIRKRFTDEIIDILLDIKWWDWSIERIKRNKLFFETDLTKISGDELKLIILP